MMPCVLRANVHDLHAAICGGMEESVHSILDQDCVNLNATVCGTTALSLSLYKERASIFELLLCHKCSRGRLDLNKLSKDEKQRVEPPLITACRLGNKQAVKLLVRSGANVDCQDSFQHTAIWMATRQRYLDLVYWLIEAGASVNPSHLWTHSPLFFAVKYSSKRTEIAKLLIYNGSDVEVQSSMSLLYCAIVQGDLNVAKMVVEAGYNVSKDEKIRSEFEAGSLTRNQELIDWLGVELTQPASLQRQCRTAIRTTLSSISQGKHFLAHLARLPLPRSVLNYLALSEAAWDCKPVWSGRSFTLYSYAICQGVQDLLRSGGVHRGEHVQVFCWCLDTNGREG